MNSKEMIKVSVLIPTFNNKKFLAKTLESVLSQTFRNFEIIVVDDGSSDQTDILIKKFQGDYPNIIKYIYQNNQGVSIARNTAISNSKGEYVAWLDSDDIWEKNYLEISIKTIENIPDVALVHTNIIRINEKDEVIEIPQREKKYLSGQIFEHLFLRKAHIACSTVLMKRICFENVGLFDPYLTRLGCEDRDMWLRISQKYQIFYIDQPLTRYRVHLNSMSQNKSRMLTARLYIIDKFSNIHSRTFNLKNRALSKVYRDLGDEELNFRNYKLAISYYSTSLSCNLFAIWSLINLSKAIIKLLLRKT